MDELWKGIKKDINRVEEEISASISNSDPKVLYNASRHLIMTGGKRIRPILLTLSFNTVGGNGVEKILPITVAIELIHTATIIHDDILDRSSMRRGVETVNMRWGNDIALIAGDLIFSRAFGMVASYGNREVSEVISNACRRLAEGQALENIHTGDVKMTEEVYLEIIERKTASLFEASTKCGAVLGGGSKEEIEALAKYGHLMGVCFQITDDILDINSGEIKLGKPVGVDVSLGKPTLVILHALKVASAKDRKILEDIIRGKSTDINKALKIIKSTDSIEYASDRSKSFIMKAKEAIEDLPFLEAKKSLELIADYAIRREF